MAMNAALDIRGFSAFWTSEDRSPTTFTEYRRHLLRYFAVHEAITLVDAREFINAETARSRSQGRYASRALKAYSRWLAAENDEPDVLAKLKMPKEARPDPKRTHVAGRDEVAALLQACEDSQDNLWKRDHALIHVLNSGMRRSECARLKWADIDMGTGAVTINKSKNGESRTTRLTPDALASLQRHRDDCLSPHVWWSLYGHAINPAGLSRILIRRSEQAGVKLTAHTFRRGATVDYLRRGGSEAYAMRLMGWKSNAMVARYVSTVAQSEALDEHKRLYG